jgi:glycosyltransferase involved in cell wall biosynthesis
MDRAGARAALGVGDKDFVVGFVGRLAEQKNPLDAVAAIAAVDAKLGAKLVVIGDGELRELAERAAAAGKAPVLFAGARDAKPLFSAFDCLLCTSRYEGMPVSFLEALNCGVPIISYPVGGTEELVVDGETGFVVDPAPAAAAAAIAKLASLPKAALPGMVQACRAKAADHSDAIMGANTLKVYESVLERRP